MTRAKSLLGFRRFRCFDTQVLETRDPPIADASMPLGAISLQGLILRHLSPNTILSSVGKSHIRISRFLLPCARDFQFPDPRLCGISHHVSLLTDDSVLFGTFVGPGSQTLSTLNVSRNNGTILCVLESRWAKRQGGQFLRHTPLDRTTYIQPPNRRDFFAAKCRVKWQLRDPDNC
jgi:hypothetical protein